MERSVLEMLFDRSSELYELYIHNYRYTLYETPKKTQKMCLTGVKTWGKDIIVSLNIWIVCTHNVNVSF